MPKTLVVIRTSFSALHCWPDCPIEEVSYLKNLHRHTFHVEMRWEVKHDNREIEFIAKKNEVNLFLQEYWNSKNLKSMSCEMMAKELARLFFANYVSVFEDNENGSIYYNE